MFYIKLNDQKELVVTVREPIYRGENLNQKLTYLIPKRVDDIDMLTAYVYLTYIRPDGAADIVVLERMEEPYNPHYFQYTVPIHCKMTRFPGELCTWLQIYSGSLSCPVVAKSGECVLQVQASCDIDGCICDSQLTALYQIHRSLDAKMDEVEGRVQETMAQKADNIVFHEEDSTIQLTSNGEPVGDRIFVTARTGRLIQDVQIDENGELIVTFDDGTSASMGRVVGRDGSVYVPHIDAHKVLTFTVEDAPGDPPGPVDLNPFDEWSEIEDEGRTDYVWEPM